jgi:hypothetical protein
MRDEKYLKMPVVNVDDLVRLQRKPEDIRNVSAPPNPRHKALARPLDIARY